MIEPQLRPGIAKAAEAFWKWIDARTPPIIKDGDRLHVHDALMIALATLNNERDKMGGPG